MGEIVRLQRYIAMCGVCSRRKAEELITADRVKVNNQIANELGTKIEIGADKVKVDNREISYRSKLYHIMLNKPKGYITSSSDQFDRPTVIDLVSQDIHSRVFSVGRLDYNTEGLLFLTNDGDFAYKITHPKNQVEKTYIASLKKPLAISEINRLRRGVKIDDYVTQPAKVEILDSKTNKMTIKITIHEGKNRQVRKMIEAVGSEVSELKRVSVGTVELGNLPLGRWRYLTAHEVNYLKNM